MKMMIIREKLEKTAKKIGNFTGRSYSAPKPV